MLKIRFQRFGRKHEPAFRLVVTESTRGPKSGNFIEILGNHNPSQKDRTQLNAERINYWISKGAQVSPTVHNLLISKGVIEGKKVNVLPKKHPLVTEGAEETAKESDTVNTDTPESGDEGGSDESSEDSKDEVVAEEEVAVEEAKESVAEPEEVAPSSEDSKDEVVAGEEVVVEEAKESVAVSEEGDKSSVEAKEAEGSEDGEKDETSKEVK